MASEKCASAGAGRARVAAPSTTAASRSFFMARVNTGPRPQLRIAVAAAADAGLTRRRGITRARTTRGGRGARRGRAPRSLCERRWHRCPPARGGGHSSSFVALAGTASGATTSKAPGWPASARSAAARGDGGGARLGLELPRHPAVGQPRPAPDRGARVAAHPDGRPRPLRRARGDDHVAGRRASRPRSGPPPRSTPPRWPRGTRRSPCRADRSRRPAP